VFHDITQHDNGSFAANAEWDACAGFGSGEGRKIAVERPVSGASSNKSGMSGMSGMAGG
jgi:hypothetical protein